MTHLNSGVFHTGPAIGNHPKGRQSRGPPGSPLSRRSRRSEPPPVYSKKVVESPEEMRTPAPEYTHDRPRCQSPGANRKLAAPETPTATPPSQPAQRLTSRGNRSVHFCRHRQIAAADVKGPDVPAPAERAGGGARKRNLKALPWHPTRSPQCSATSTMEAGRAAVLRVKRKRSAEPAEALVLACKRLRNDAVESAAQKTPPEGLKRAAENNVFQLVATVRSQVLGEKGVGVEGILGRGRGETVSLTSHEPSLTLASFPYCLPGGASSAARAGRLAPIPGQPAAYTPRPPCVGPGDPAGGPLQGCLQPPILGDSLGWPGVR